MKEKLEAQFIRTHISEEDFKEAFEYLSEWDSAKGVIQKRALLTGSIIAYSRPFLESEGRGQSTATVSLGSYKLSAEQKLLHERILVLRNSAIAHSDFDRRPRRRVEGNI